MVDFADFGANDIDERRLPKPRPLCEEMQPEPYPLWEIPALIRDAVEEVASYVQPPVAMVAACALTAVSTAVQTGFGVRRDSALSGPATLYLLTVAESGERKSTVDSIFIQPVRDWEAEQRKLYSRRRAEYKAQLEDWEKQGEELQANITSGFINPQNFEIDPRTSHALGRPTEPQLVRVLRKNDTTEALIAALDKYPVATIASAEAGTIFGSHSMKAESVTANLALANEMWDGGVIDKSTVGAGEVRVEGMRVTMGLQVQPSVLQNFVDKTGGLARGIGYFARFLFCQPETTQGTRMYKEPPAARPALAAFCQRMTTLLSIEAEFDEYDRLETQMLAFDADAQKSWIAFYDEVEEKLNYEDEYGSIRDVASKAADNAARLACCFHVFANGPSHPIARDSVLGACALMRWYLDEAVRFCGKAAAAPEIADAQMLEEWLVKETKKRARAGTDQSLVISVNQIRRTGPSQLRKARTGRLEDAVDILADHHRVLVQGRTGKKGRDIILRSEVLREYMQ
ncbi:YfjI family protein [Sphingomonas glaciei]|uniref:YfjI family protein n=1 Tax=Sphingomonas glaciei TaxID=2938948 RepID=A0ABY5MUS8_9SPHN|nr:YfjI family protein [Sphingomonas glaciei]UUR08240.1 YfjI family protein [Sphingomonas glaciei]